MGTYKNANKVTLEPFTVKKSVMLINTSIYPVKSFI